MTPLCNYVLWEYFISSTIVQHLFICIFPSLLILPATFPAGSTHVNVAVKASPSVHSAIIETESYGPRILPTLRNISSFGSYWFPTWKIVTGANFANYIDPKIGRNSKRLSRGPLTPLEFDKQKMTLTFLA